MAVPRPGVKRIVCEARGFVYIRCEVRVNGVLSNLSVRTRLFCHNLLW
jgi:hypothetical protein